MEFYQDLNHVKWNLKCRVPECIVTGDGGATIISTLTGGSISHIYLHAKPSSDVRLVRDSHQFCHTQNIKFALPVTCRVTKHTSREMKTCSPHRGKTFRRNSQKFEATLKTLQSLSRYQIKNQIL